MESNLIKDNSHSEDGNERSDQIQSLDQKDPSPIIKIEAEKREGQDFPDLSYHSSIFRKNTIVLFGGRDTNNNLNNVFNIYNLETRTWSQKELKGESDQIPKPRRNHTANVIGNAIYIIGGYVPGQQNDNVYQIDFDTLKCQIIGEIIEPVQGHSADVHNRSIYIFGGCSNKTRKRISMLQKFNLLTNKCEEIKPVGFQPEGRLNHMSIIVQDTLYVFGGGYYKNSNVIRFQDMFSIDLSNKVSTKIDQHGSIPSSRSSFSFFPFEDKIYLFGGGSKSEYCKDFYVFDLKSSCWKLQQTINEKCLLKRAAHSTVVVKESSRKLKVYLVGGKESKGSWQENMNVITISNNRIFWILHYLDCTGIHYLPGLNLVQEIIEMFE